jgi:CRP-like cAMP-binding protein
MAEIKIYTPSPCFRVSPNLPNVASLPTRHAFVKAESIPPLEDKLWLIEQGIARTFTFSEEGSVTGLGYWGKGDVIGQPLSKLAVYQIECVTPVEARLLARHEWSHHLDAILRNAQQKALLMSVLGQKQVSQRLVYLLDWLGQHFGQQVSEGLLIDIPLSHDTLSEMVGATRVTVTHYLGEFENQGALIKRRCQIILLKDLSRLNLQSISPHLSNRQRSARKAA